MGSAALYDGTGLARPLSAGISAATLDAPYGRAGKSSRVLDREWDGVALRMYCDGPRLGVDPRVMSIAGATDTRSTFVTSSPGLIAPDNALFRSTSWNCPSRSNVIFSFTDMTRSICGG